MKGYFTLFGKDIPYYGVLFFSGMVIAVIAAYILKSKRNIKGYHITGSAVYTFIGALIGSKLLAVITSLKYVINNHIPLESLIKGGFVFYGGLIGGTVGLLLYIREFKQSYSDFLSLYAVICPLGHSIGRIGCFISGCCYGVEYDGALSFTYHEAINTFTPLNTPLLPIQLIESVLLFLLFILLLAVFLKCKIRTFPIYIYLMSYATIRFTLEFFRGDIERGGIGIFSTSQIISLIIFVICGIIICNTLYIKKILDT